jgi:hypothetical protein
MHDVFSYPITGAMGTVENAPSGEQRGRHVCSRASSFQRGGFIGSLTLPTAVLPSIESDFVTIDQSAQPRALEDGQGFFDPVFVWITLIRGLTVRACSEA